MERHRWTGAVSDRCRSDGFQREVRLGMIVPSSNTNAESATYRMLSGLPWVTAHFSRFPLPARLDVTIGTALLHEPAALLAEARIDALAFHGTSGSWRGVGGDQRLCEELAARVGVSVTTATVATLAALGASGRADRVGLAFPGERAIAEAIAAEYGRRGVHVVAISSDETLSGNHQIAALPVERIDALVETACVPGVEVVAVIGTNLRAAARAVELERRTGVLVVDSAAATLWHLLEVTQAEGRPTGWGELFSLSAI